MITGPDSNAQIAIQAAERLGTLGAGAPWDLCPPLAPWLIAGLSFLPGMTPERSYVTLVLLAFLGSAAIVFLLWRRLGASALLASQAAALALLAPSGILAIWERGEIDRLLFWKLLPLVFLAIDAFRRKPNALRLGLFLATLTAMALTRSERLIAIDLLALLEWVAVLAVCGPWRNQIPGARFARPGLAALLAAAGLARLQAVQEPGALPPMPAELSTGERVVGPVSLEAELHPFAKQVHELIRSELRPRESVLWLQALGARAVVAPEYGKFHGQLECVAREAGWCRFEVAPTPRAALVSRERFSELKPIRGLFDVEGLERYLTWALRPEAAGFEQSGAAIEVQADAGADDLILVRVGAAEWKTANGGEADPLGFLVLDPGGAGLFEAHLQHENARGPGVALDDGDYPQIAPEGVVDSTSYSGPPFEPGAYLSIFGNRLRTGASRVLVDEIDAAVPYISSTQANIRLPDGLSAGPHTIVVEGAGRRSYPYTVEVKAP